MLILWSFRHSNKCQSGLCLHYKWAWRLKLLGSGNNWYIKQVMMLQGDMNSCIWKIRHTIHNVDFIGFHHEKHANGRNENWSKNKPCMDNVCSRPTSDILCLLLSYERIIVFNVGTECLVFNNIYEMRNHYNLL